MDKLRMGNDESPLVQFLLKNTIEGDVVKMLVELDHTNTACVARVDADALIRFLQEQVMIHKCASDE